MAKKPALEEGHERLALIQRLWKELQAVKYDRAQYDALVVRIRTESEAFLQTIHTHDPTSNDG